MRYYTMNYQYQLALAAPGAMRVSLDGEAVEPVSAEHAEFARQHLELVAAKAAAERQAMRAMRAAEKAAKRASRALVKRAAVS
jgi:ProP effector